MKRIGLITYFYNSTNYGGILQAYALCKAINSSGRKLVAEQICYDYDSYTNYQKLAKSLYLNKVKTCVRNILRNYRTCNNRIKRDAFRQFVDLNIQKSDQIFNYKTITEANILYDVFIAGSDQVWNPISMDSNFFLEFVESTKGKFSYAASLGADKIDDDKLRLIVKKVQSFISVSVRENTGKEMLTKIGMRNVYVVPDPVFLLTKDMWSDLCKGTLEVEDDYLFTYFLSPNKNIRKKAQAFARDNNLKIVDFSPLHMYDNNSLYFSERDPAEFIKYISNSSYCITDSFHGSAFCVIFGKRFVVISKEDTLNISSNDRMRSMLSAFDLTDRMISDRDDLDCVIKKDIKIKDNIERYRNEGLDYLYHTILDPIE